MVSIGCPLAGPERRSRRYRSFSAEVNEFSKERVPDGNFLGYPIDNSAAARVDGS